jgi:peptidoglycan/LPS O-acetylase OafA/YrhL
VTNPEASPPFDLRDTSALKAIGILAIVLHNFYHKLPYAVGENEFGFTPGRFERFLNAVTDYHESLQALFSYFGHLGVQLFIFLSAYGLALKYWTVPAWGGFFRGRISKIYPMYFLALGLWALLVVVKDGSSDLLTQADNLLLTSLAVINLVPGYGLPPVGPWWFLPFIVQFYALWPALAAYSRHFGGSGVALLCAVVLGATMALHPLLIQNWAINLFETPVGHLPELCLGIACARFGLRIGPISALAATGVFVLGNLYEAFWPFTFVSALMMILYAYQLTRRVWRERSVLERIAEVSMPLFFVNGFLRGPFLAAAAQFDRWYVDILMGLGFASFAWGVAYGLSTLEQRLLPLMGRWLAPSTRG